MANSLNTNLRVGQAVELPNGEIVHCMGGFGMYSSTAGTAIFVKDKLGNEFRISGQDVLRVIPGEEQR